MDHDEHLQHHDDILRSLTTMLVEQRTMNERMEGFVQQQLEINQRLEITQTRIETLLARMLAHDSNGRDA